MKTTGACVLPYVSILLLLSSTLLIASYGSSAAAASADERANKSSWGSLFWSTGKDEADLVAKRDVDLSEGMVDDGIPESDNVDGGFSSLDGMLQWAIGHSDPEKLKEKANEAKRLSTDELKKRQLEIKELMDKLKMPSDGELMKIAISDLNNDSLSFEDRKRALDELLILVEPIDNANDLDKLGGLVVLVQELNSLEPELRTASAWILGKASQNNPIVQQQIIAYGALTKLMKMVKSDHIEEAVKALYAVSALIRNNEDGQQIFYSEAGGVILQDLMGDVSIDIRLRKKAVFLVADLADSQLENDGVSFPFFTNRLLLKSIVNLISSNDLDLQEKALLAIRSLLQLTTTDAQVFKEYCGLDDVLVALEKQLAKLMTDVDIKDFAMDMESLRREVERIYHEKMDLVTAVPT